MYAALSPHQYQDFRKDMAALTDIELAVKYGFKSVGTARLWRKRLEGAGDYRPKMIDRSAAIEEAVRQGDLTIAGIAKKTGAGFSTVCTHIKKLGGKRKDRSKFFELLDSGLTPYKASTQAGIAPATGAKWARERGR